MSEVTPTPEDLVEDFDVEVEDATVIPSPIDPTLSHAGEAADAKAVGDALENIASRIKVNSKTSDNTGNITVYASDILMSSEIGAQTVSAAIASADARTGATIIYKSGSTDTIAEVVDDITDALEDGVTDTEIDNIFEEW